MSSESEHLSKQVELLTEFHRRTHRLCLWSIDAKRLLTSLDPHWDEIHSLFSTYGEIRQWLLNHWSILELFELPRYEAVEWQQSGWRNWHATVVESIVHNGYEMRLGIWIEKCEDNEGKYVVWPDQLDWRCEDLGLSDEIPGLERSRDAIWRRVKSFAYQNSSADQSLNLFGMPSERWHDCCWAYLGDINPWTHIAHLRSEFSATRRLLDPQSPLTAPPKPIIYHGPGTRYRFWWKGKSVDFDRKGKRFKLCAMLWNHELNAPAEECQTTNVLDTIWPEDAGTRNDNYGNLKSLADEVRRDFEAAEIPLTIEITRQLIWLAERPD